MSEQHNWFLGEHGKAHQKSTKLPPAILAKVNKELKQDDINNGRQNIFKASQALGKHNTFLYAYQKSNPETFEMIHTLYPKNITSTAFGKYIGECQNLLYMIGGLVILITEHFGHTSAHMLKTKEPYKDSKVYRSLINHSGSYKEIILKKKEYEQADLLMLELSKFALDLGCTDLDEIENGVGFKYTEIKNNKEKKEKKEKKEIT